MDHNAKTWVLNAVKDITVAKMSNSTTLANKDGGQNVAAFMEAIYSKLSELVDESSNSNQ